MDVDLEEELLGLITSRVLGHERSQQKRIGPSGLGTPCTRKLGFRLLEVPRWGPDEPAWRPTVGTAVHSWLQAMLEADNARLEQEALLWAELDRARLRPTCHSWCSPEEHLPRWIPEINMACGTIDGEEIPGTSDVYDRLTETVIDWKVNGPTALKEYRRRIAKGEGPPADYRVQAHVYGRGLTRKLGLPVKNVAILFLPMNGELRDAVYWSEPYDPQVGREAFDRAREVKADLDDGAVLLSQLRRVDDHCGHCDWFNPGAADDELEISCPGHPGMVAPGSTPGAEELLGLSS